MTGRTVKEWIGKTPDAKVPDRVKDRILERYDHTCWLSGRPIAPGDKWEVEHKVPLWLTGQHRESNLAPALVDAHKAKTKAEAPVRAKVTRLRQKHAGIKKAKGRPMPGSKASGWRKRMDGTAERRT